jgi:hypothetical protein
MKKRCLFMVLPLLVLVLAGTSYGWQGRMGGMGDPYGLVQDESDFLTHPAKIADGQGTKLYTNYRFTFRGVDDLGYDVDAGPAGFPPVFSTHYSTSGDEQTHDISTGIVFPAGSGRLGIFANYTFERGSFDGASTATVVPVESDYSLKNRFDAFAFRLFYGLPIGHGFKLGGEAQLAYRGEKNETELTNALLGFYRNNIFGSFVLFVDSAMNLYPFMTPYDSSYMEALFKGSVAGKVGPLDLAFTVRGGFLFAGNNDFSYLAINALLPGILDVKGDVQGWRLGGDLWLRYPLKADFAIPFLVRVDYQEKTRDGEGVGTGGVPPFSFDYKNREKSFNLEVGGGPEIQFAKGTKAAAGIYYSYVKADNDFDLKLPSLSWQWDRSDYPNSAENRILVRLVGEHVLSRAITLQMGLHGFFGWVTEDYNYTTTAIFPTSEDVSLSGHRWGLGGSFGAVVKVFRGVTLEPFVNAGYQETTLDGNGSINLFPTFNVEMEKTTQEWLVGGGLSVLFDL